MSRTILVPLDGSPFAEHALPAALAIARRTGAALELVIVDRAPVPCDASALAMTTHARRGVSRFVMGSVADKVLRTAACPVMLFHPTHEVVDLRRRVEAATEAAVPL